MIESDDAMDIARWLSDDETCEDKLQVSLESPTKVLAAFTQIENYRPIIRGIESTLYLLCQCTWDFYRWCMTTITVRERLVVYTYTGMSINSENSLKPYQAIWKFWRFLKFSIELKLHSSQ